MTAIRFITGSAPMPDGPVYAMTEVRRRKWWQFWRPREVRGSVVLYQFRNGFLTRLLG